MFGLNEVLVKNQQTGEIVSHKIYKDGLYGKYIVKIVDELEKAIEFSENEKQKKSIKSLITFYNSGDVTDFDKHAIDWAKTAYVLFE